MQKKSLLISMALVLLLSLIAAPEILAERATQQEMELVCQNWLSYMVYQRGAWAGETRPEIVQVDEMVENDTVLARCFSVSPTGYVVVPILKELPPVKVYSEEYRLDVDQRVGFPQLLREVLLSRIRLYARVYGSLDAVQPPTGDVLLGRGHKAQWELFSKNREEFQNDLTQRTFEPLIQVGPLLTSSWHQGSPYYNLCPMGDGGRCVVGCVATATAQILKYWNWPPSGTGSHSYTWDGDDSCDGPVGGGTLSATFSDPYDWANMPNNCDGGCTPTQRNALAELCYEVGVAFEMDYGACGSGTWTYMALNVFPDYFKYDSSIDRENRVDHSPASWFSTIQNEINMDRPIQYRIYRHSIICDGWRDTGGQNQYHMNYGWGGSHTAWYGIDSLYCYWVEGDTCPIAEEYLIRNIFPDYHAVILIDVSGSMNTQRTTGNSRLQDAITFAQQDVQTNIPDGTEIAVMYFSSAGIVPHLSFTDNKQDVVYALYTIPIPNNATPLADAMCAGAEWLKNQGVLPGWLYTYTDGRENVSKGSAVNLCDPCDTLSGGAWNYDCDPSDNDPPCTDWQYCLLDCLAGEVIYTVRYFGDPIDEAERDSGPSDHGEEGPGDGITPQSEDLAFLRYLAEQSGGECYVVPSPHGDCDSDGVIGLSDVVYLINYLLKEGIPPDPLPAGDVNCDDDVGITDVVYLINYLFRAGPPPCF